MGPRGASRDALLRKVGLMLPRYSQSALLAHDSWHTAYKLCAVRGVTGLVVQPCLHTCLHSAACCADLTHANSR